jgi:uncharacterized membrane protein YbaN (DUF454 family)
VADPFAQRRPIAPPGTARLRLVWVPVGLLCVAVGGIGVVVPVLPSTPFFIVAAGAFARSSPRLERWVLGLPAVGPLVRDHRAGLGIPIRAKAVAVSMVVVAVALSLRSVEGWPLRLTAVAAAGVGVATVLTRPTAPR